MVVGIVIGLIADENGSPGIFIVGGTAVGVGTFLWVLKLSSRNQDDTTPPSAGQGCVIALCGGLLGFFGCLGAFGLLGGPRGVTISGIFVTVTLGGFVLLICGIVLAIARAVRRDT